MNQFIHALNVNVLLVILSLPSQSGIDTSMSRLLLEQLALKEQRRELLSDFNIPVRGPFLSPIIINSESEFLEVLRDILINDLFLVLRFVLDLEVLKLRLVGLDPLQIRILLDVLFVNQWFPAFSIVQVEVKHRWIVPLLNISVDVVVSHDAPDALKLTFRIVRPNVHIDAWFGFAAHNCVLDLFSPEKVTFSFNCVPELAVIIIFVSSQDVGGVTFRDAFAKHDAVLDVGSVLLLVDVLEVVAQKDGVLFVVALTEVKEFL